MTIELATRADELVLTHRAHGLELDLAPLQGMWTEDQYLTLSNHSSHLLELHAGEFEVLAMPTDRHQAILRFLFVAFFSFEQLRKGTVFFAPLRMRIRTGTYREPDLLLLLDAEDARRQDRFWLGADLVLEVVSPDDPHRDLVTKRVDYAEADIPEYWIVNPVDETITVLTLREEGYQAHGIFTRGTQASSELLSGFYVDVAAVFDAR